MTFSSQLTPEQIAALSAPGAMGNVSVNGMYFNPLSNANFDTTNTVDSGVSRPVSGFMGYEAGKTNPGDYYGLYDESGKLTETKQYVDTPWLSPELAMFLAAVGGMYFGLPALGAGAEATAGGLSPAMWGDAGMMYGGADAAAAGSLGGGAAAAGGAGAAGAGGAAAGAGSAATAAGGLLSGAGGVLGPAATLLGGLAGAQGNDQSQTATREPWAPLQPFLKDKLIPAAGNLLDFQMSYLPEQSKQISNQAMGLLQMPMAQNGFAQFQAKPRFGTGGF